MKLLMKNSGTWNSVISNLASFSFSTLVEIHRAKMGVILLRSKAPSQVRVPLLHCHRVLAALTMNKSVQGQED